ncbi:MAG: glycosyltransferase family 2 protein [Pseudomonadota bacterium]|jgi:predicted LPLAT superfamily acyltransferase/GT2 family glycosyltransferase
MVFRPCLVIPNYNHGYALESIVSSVERYGLELIVVNDASTDSTATIIDNLSATHSWISVIHRSSNGGKGAAIRDGLLKAYQRGFTHAVCIDGDGQHACDDIPKFITLAREHPDSLILGVPQFGVDAPLARRLGREVSNVLIALATWSFQVRDVLCGFRLYPLRRVVPELNLMELEPRMGFDVEIVARAVWAGIPVRSVPTRVWYPEGGVSHFRYGRDNLTMFRLQTKLLLAGLWRGPIRLARNAVRPVRRADWYQMTERGSAGGLHFLLRVFELLGRRVLLILLVPVTIHMFVFCRTARRSAVEFQKRVAQECSTGQTILRRYTKAFQQFWEFGVSIVDKVISWRHGLPLNRFTWEGRDEVKALLAKKQGVILVGAHVGNVEVIRAIGETRNLIIHALMFTGHAANFKRLLEGVNSEAFLRVHDLQTVDAALIFTLQEAISRGEVVALLGDRVPKLSASRSVLVPFLGEIASLPEGPWILASMLEAPVFSVFSMRGNDGLYHVQFAPLADRVTLPRNGRSEAVCEYAQRFIKHLEAVVKRYPTQWYNFFNFWQKDMP